MMRAKIHGASALSAKFKKMESDLPGNLRRATIAGAMVMRDEAEQLAPRAGGWVSHEHMADNIVAEVRSAGYGCQAKIGPSDIGEEGAGIWMRQGLEEGTARAAAQPFLRPALDTKKNEALRAFADEMKRGAK